MIEFGAPLLLVFLVIVAGMGVAAVRFGRWQARARGEFAGPQAGDWPVSATWPRLVLVLVAAALIVFAAARPQWGTNDFVRQQQGIDLVIVLDVSQSMQATDVAPSRMGLAQSELSQLIESLRGSRIGLVFFAGSAMLRSPLSTDTQSLAQIIQRADRESGLTRAGSDIGAALSEAGRALAESEAPGKAVLVVSDGEDFGRSFEAQAASLRERGIAVFSAGVGTPQGAGLFDPDLRTGQQRPKLDSTGRPVVTRLDEAPLRAVASTGGGRYIHLEPGSGLASVRDDLALLEQTPLGQTIDILPIERFQAFAVAALLLLVEAWLLPAHFLLPSPKRLRRTRPNPGVALLLLAVVTGACGGSDLPRKENAAANRLFAEERYEEALAAYEALLARRPDIEALSYNAGNTLHRLGNYERAVAETQRALPPTDTRIGARTYYSLGNHLLALEQVEQAYAAYRNALILDPTDADAKHNLELTLAILRERQPPPPQQGGPPSGTPSPDATPQPGETGEPSPEQTPQDGGGGQPLPSQTPQPGQTPQELTRQLEDALRGIDEDLSFEDAVRILDLLRQQLNQPRNNGGLPQPGAPDY